MKISDQELDSYIALYEKRFNKTISRQEALRQAISLLTLMKAIYKPIKKSDLQKLKKYSNK